MVHPELTKEIGFMKTIFIAMFAIILAGCAHQTASDSKPDTPAAIAFVQKAHPSIHVSKVDEKTIGVIWEVRSPDPLERAEDPFERLKLKLKKDYGVDIVITAIE
jgi:hypothetical protein